MNSLGIVKIQKISLRVDTLWPDIYLRGNNLQQKLVSPKFPLRRPLSPSCCLS